MNRAFLWSAIIVAATATAGCYSANPLDASDGPPDGGGLGKDADTPDAKGVPDAAAGPDGGDTPDASGKPDAGGAPDASSSPDASVNRATWAYLYPAYFQGSGSAGHCNSCHGGSVSASDSSFVSGGFSRLGPEGGPMPTDKTWSDATAKLLLDEWKAAGFP